MKNHTLIAIVIVALVALLGCDKKAQTEEPQPTETASTEAETNQGGAETAEEPAQEEEAEPAEGEEATADASALDPSKATETAPKTFTTKFETTAGDFKVKVHRDWAPKGADRFYNLVKLGYFKDIAAFRVIDGFMAQFGLHGDPAITKAWRDAKIQDDPVKESNTRGRLTFAMAGPNTRTTQLFISYRDNSMLDKQGFSPIGEVVGDGMNVVDKFYKGYGEGAPRGKGPNQGKIMAEGNAYLKKDFPKLTYIKSISLVEE
jgi:peptidyl-prolyl cis-trans isomerase A (cyclophilin A)